MPDAVRRFLASPWFVAIVIGVFVMVIIALVVLANHFWGSSSTP